MAGQEGEPARLTEAALGLMQAVSAMAVEQRQQWQQGQMLRALLELAAEKLKGEMRLDELILALIGRLDAHAGAMARMEAGFGQIGAAMEWAGRE